MEFLRRKGIALLALAALSGMFLLRLTAYGAFHLSVATADTTTYIQGGAPPIFSADTLTRSRLLTTNLLYHFVNVQGCKPNVTSYPAIQTETYRGVQPCFAAIAVLQNVVSIFAWAGLALVVSKRLKGGFEKILAVILISGFGYTPAVADWDSILGSESLTFSLFALSLGLILETGFQIAEVPDGKRFPTLFMTAGFASFTLWAFTRDANIYTLAVLTAASTLSAAAIPALRGNKKLLGWTAAFFVIVVIGLQSATLSRRWEVPLANVYNDLIFPYPARVEFMKNLGMPKANSPAYRQWFVENAPGAYARFLLFHPGYTAALFTAELDGIFSENIQPYFYSEKTTVRLALESANDLLHPKTGLVFALDILMAAGLSFAAFRKRNPVFLTWLWFGLWLFFSALLTMAVGFFADSIGVTRHTMFAVEIFRLMNWLFLLILLDHTNRAA
jgi:hypothetical protein